MEDEDIVLVSITGMEKYLNRLKALDKYDNPKSDRYGICHVKFIGYSEIWEKNGESYTTWFLIEIENGSRPKILVKRFTGRFIDKLDPNYWNNHVHEYVGTEYKLLPFPLSTSDLILGLLEEVEKTGCCDNIGNYFINPENKMFKERFSAPMWMIQLGTLKHDNPNEQWDYLCGWFEAYYEKNRIIL